MRFLNCLSSSHIAKYDIVFLDVNMDELDGMETAQKIRKVSNDVFIVFVTAFITCAPQVYAICSLCITNALMLQSLYPH